jgi:hypothetical protein
MTMKVTVTVDCDCCCHHHHKEMPLIGLGPTSEQPKHTGPPQEKPMLATLTDTQQVVATYGGPVDAKGNVAAVESLTFQSSDPATATFVAGVPDSSGNIVPDTANDGKIRGTIVAKAAGVCRVNITADADLGDGVKTIDGEMIDVQVTGGEAVGFGAPTVGTPTSQPPAPTPTTRSKK